MLIVFLWLGSVLPERYTEVITNCESYPGNRCVILQEVHEKILLEKYKNLLHLSKPRLDSLIMVERTDILRLLYLYDKGGIYSDLDNKIDYACLERFIGQNKDSFFFGHEQFDSKKPSNNFIYAPTPGNPELRRVIQKIHECEQCTDLNFASPYFLNRIKVPFRVVKDCIKHGYESTWYWTKHPNLKSPQQARQEAQKRARQDEAAAGDPTKQKALAEQREQQKWQASKDFFNSQSRIGQHSYNATLTKCREKIKELADERNSVQVKINELKSSKLSSLQKDRQIEEGKQRKNKTENKNVKLQNDLQVCQEKIESKANCPKNQTICPKKQQKKKQSDCPEKEDTMFLGFIASSVAFGALLLCNIVNCCKRKQSIKYIPQRVASMDSSRETYSERMQSEQNSNMEIQSRALKNAVKR